MADRDTREYPARPICGVGVIAFRDDDSLLLIRRAREPRRGEWSIPGGAVELGESVRDAALREFREECGGEIRLRELVDVVDIFSRDDAGRMRYHYIVVDYWAEWVGGTLQTSDELIEARWVSANDLDAYALPPWTRAVIEKAVAMHKLAGKT
jgi:ADP-ribose pyrophosphatase YjhB (NUDIX family)